MMAPEAGPRLILLCGLPGSGKTTFAKRLASRTPIVRLCPDEWMADLGIDLFDVGARDRLERRFWILAQDVLRTGGNVILKSGFWLRSDRDEKRLGARAIGATVELRFLDVPIDELVRRLDEREATSASAGSRAPSSNAGCRSSSHPTRRSSPCSIRRWIRTPDGGRSRRRLSRPGRPPGSAAHERPPR